MLHPGIKSMGNRIFIFTASFLFMLSLFAAVSPGVCAAGIRAEASPEPTSEGTVTGASATSYGEAQTWYLAEGYTGGQFDTYVLVQNPGSTSAHVTLKFQLPPGHSAPDYEFDLPAGTRSSIQLDGLPGLSNTDVSTKVVSTAPVMVERAMYFSYYGKSGGHDSLGAKYEPPVIPETTKVLGQEEMGNLLGSQETEDKIILTFAAGNPVIDGLALGDVIVSGKSSQAPGGLLLKVTKITKAAGKVTLETVGAAIEEAIESGRLQAIIPLSASQLASTTILDESVSFRPSAGETNFQPAAETTLDFTYNFDDTRLEMGNAWVELDGEVTLGITMSVELQIKKWSLKKFSFSTTFFENVEVSATAAYDILNIDKEKELVYHRFNDITFTVAGVPIVLSPYVNLHVGIKGNVAVGVSCGATQSGSVTTGASYDNGEWSPIADKSFSFDWTYPKPVAEAEFKAYAGPQIGLKFYRIAGPYVNIEPYVRLGVDLVNTPHWEVFVGVELDLGVIVQVRTMLWTKTFLDKKFDGLLEWEMLLASDVGVTSLSPETGPAGTLVTINGYGFGVTRENDSFVKFGDVRAEEYVSWSDKTIKCKVPASVTGTVEVKVTHVFHKWGPVTIKVTSNAKPFTVTGGGGSAGGWEVQLSGAETLYGVDALDAGHVWAVGAGGTILFYNGSSWTAQNSGTTKHLYDVSAAAANRVWAVGYEGILLYYDGTSWKEQDSGQEGRDLNGVYAADATHVWAVGDQGSIVYWNGTYWTHQESGTTVDLYRVEGTGPGNVWVVGAGGTVLRYNGSTWSKITGIPPNNDYLTDVWVKDANNVWILGVNLYHFNGSTWTTIGTGWTEGLCSVAGLAPAAVWTGRWYGVIFFWNGSDWEVQYPDENYEGDINDIDILDATHIWAVGGSGWGNLDGMVAFKGSV